jgi:hypothetical protein
MTQKPADGYPEIRLRKEGESTYTASSRMMGLIQSTDWVFAIPVLLVPKSVMDQRPKDATLHIEQKHRMGQWQLPMGVVPPEVLVSLGLESGGQISQLHVISTINATALAEVIRQPATKTFSMICTINV